MHVRTLTALVGVTLFACTTTSPTDAPHEGGRDVDERADAPPGDAPSDTRPFDAPPTEPYVELEGELGRIRADLGELVIEPYQWWDDFEGHTDGDGSDSLGYAHDFGEARVTTARSHSGSASLRASYPETTTGEPAEGFYEVRPPLTPTPSIYVSFWSYLEQTATATTPNFAGELRTNFRLLKFWRAGGGTPYGGRPQANDTLFFDAAGAVTGHDASASTTVGTEGRPADGALPLGEPRMGAWHFCEYEYALSPSGSVFRSRVDGQRLIDVAGPAEPTSGVIEWTYLFTGGDYYQRNGYVHDVDEYYVSSSVARVVITDASDYAASSRWAIQPVTSSAPLEFRLNLGSFPSGASAWAHVFDGTGAEVLVVQMTTP